jgi:hypothetical protein
MSTVSVSADHSASQGQRAQHRTEKDHIGAGQHTRLRGCGHAAEDAAHDDGGGDQRGCTGERVAPDLAQARLLLRGKLTMCGKIAVEDHQAEGHQQPGPDTREKHPRHGHIGQEGIDDQRDRRWNERRHDGRDHRDGRGKRRTVALLAHRADLDRAKTGDVGCRRARAACEQHRSQHVHLRQPGAEVPHQRVGEVEDAFGDPDGVHQVTRQHEEGDRQQGNVGRCLQRLHRHDPQHAAETRHGQRPDNGHPDSHDDRRLERDQPEEHAEQAIAVTMRCPARRRYPEKRAQLRAVAAGTRP